MRLAFAILGLLAAAAAQAACRAESGPTTAALVELYTSEGCSSCPPADRWLSSLSERGYTPERVVPLALHVDYWDYIGWKDPYARRAFSDRQRKLTVLQRMALVYTPQVLLQGRDFRGWGSPAFDRAVSEINRRPAGARLRLEILSSTPASVEVEAQAALADKAKRSAVGLYLAAYGNRLESRVTAGENAGRMLAHDHVVLEWQGPFVFGTDGRLAVRRTLPLLPGAKPANSGVAAFVQDRNSAEVLQALMRPAC